MEIKSKEIVIVDVETLVLNPKNNNKHTDKQIKQLAKIIKYQGFRTPIVVSNRTGFVVAGHARIEAAKKLGMDQVPVIFQDFEDEAQEYAHLTADNAIAAQAEIDLSMVNVEIGDFGPDFDIEMLGLDDFKVDVSEKLDPQCDEDEVPEVSNTITKRGDVWILGAYYECEKCKKRYEIENAPKECCCDL